MASESFSRAEIWIKSLDETLLHIKQWVHSPTSRSQSRYVNSNTGKVGYFKTPPKGSKAQAKKPESKPKSQVKADSVKSVATAVQKIKVDGKLDQSELKEFTGHLKNLTIEQLKAVKSELGVSGKSGAKQKHIDALAERAKQSVAAKPKADAKPADESNPKPAASNSPQEIADRAYSIYDSPFGSHATGESLDQLREELSGMKKQDLVSLANRVGIAGAAKKSQKEIANAIHFQISERVATYSRRQQTSRASDKPKQTAEQMNNRLAQSNLNSAQYYSELAEEYAKKGDKDAAELAMRSSKLYESMAKRAMESSDAKPKADAKPADDAKPNAAASKPKVIVDKVKDMMTDRRWLTMPQKEFESHLQELDGLKGQELNEAVRLTNSRFRAAGKTTEQKIRIVKQAIIDRRGMFSRPDY